MQAPLSVNPSHRTVPPTVAALLASLLLCGMAWAAPRAPATVPTPAPTPAAAPAQATPPVTAGAPVSASGQQVYDVAKSRLLQVRTLLKVQDSQSSVGSGFLVEEGSAGALIVSNYHVISQFALQPQNHRLVYVTSDGQQGPLQLIDFDVVNDVALLRPAQPQALAGRGVLAFRPAAEPMARGERIYALGNPLDVGFAVMEGAYNGLVERSFVPTLFFGGSLSGGMSGGPALDAQGRVMGVNVATRRDGQQVSFLVPADAARALLARSRAAPPITAPAYPKLTQQLTAYQAALTERFLALPWRPAGHSRYTLPLPQEQFMRCWGSGSSAEARGLDYERSDCQMDNRVFVGGGIYTGGLHTRHEVYEGRRLGLMRFTHQYAAGFTNEGFGADTRQLTAPQCVEDFVDHDGLPLRALLCLRGYKRLPGLYDMSVLVATLDQNTAGVQARFDAAGVSFDNAQKLAAHYINGFAIQSTGRKQAGARP